MGVSTKNLPILIAGCVSIFVIIAGVVWLEYSGQRPTDNSASSDVVRPENNTNSMYASMHGDDFDTAYLVDMIAHHQGALNMASVAKEISTKEEIRTLADAILSSQTEEVQHMMNWQGEWGYLGTNSSNPHAGHMMESNGTMSEAMATMEAKLAGLSGEAFNKEFLTQMIAHHQQAIDMSQYAEQNAKHQEVKDLSRSVIATQTEEISTMKRWCQEWGY